MADNQQYVSFLGSGWSFPPRFVGSGVAMSDEEQDIKESLTILFNTAPGERILEPKFGLDMNALLFEPMSTTLKSLTLDRVRTAILIYEPRIKPLKLQIESPDPDSGTLKILLEYQVRSSNSRFNLVFPFYTTDSNEVRSKVAGTSGGAS